MPTIEQIRAARALLGWNQHDLADKAGLSQTGIARIENGTNNPNSKTLEKIETAFDKADIEFIDGGVRKRVNKVTLYEGKEGFAKFRLDTLHEAETLENADICVANVNERLYDKWGEGEPNENYRSKMPVIKKNNPNLRFRSIVKEGDERLPAIYHSEYRALPEKEFGDFPFYIFGEKTALMMFEEDNVSIFIIDHPMVTKFYREIFEENWKKAKEL
jgi:transcriptional regulator with XRE-family HTH domain